MKAYIIEAVWEHGDMPRFVGICDSEHIEDLKNKYLTAHKNSLNHFRKFKMRKYNFNDLAYIMR